jgi:hypothetical protein
MSEGNFKEKEKLATGPRWAPDTKTDWPTDCRSQINFNFIFNFSDMLSVFISGNDMIFVFTSYKCSINSNTNPNPPDIEIVTNINEFYNFMDHSC